MASVTLSISEEFKNRLKEQSWVNWSEIAREEITKKLIFENYLKSGKVTDEEWNFCEKIDWHPADNLPLKKEFIRKIHGKKPTTRIKVKSFSEILK